MFKRLAKEPAPPWSYMAAFGVLIGMFVAVLLGSTLVEILLEPTSVTLLVGWSIGMALTIIVVVASRMRSPEEVAALRLRADGTRLGVVAAFALGMAVFFDLVGWVIVGDRTLASAELLRFDVESVSIFGWLVALIFLVVLQPIAEEMIFRGMMLPAMVAAIGPGIAFVGVSAFHAIFHFAAYPPPPDDTTILVWYGVILPFWDGLVFTAVRARTGSTRASVVAHAVFGLFFVFKVIAFAA